MTHHLTDDERGLLRAANLSLTKITLEHGISCRCVLCEARMLTDVQEDASYHVQYLPGDQDAEQSEWLDTTMADLERRCEDDD